MKQRIVLVFLLLLTVAGTALAQEAAEQKSMEIYGFIMTDAGYNFNQIDPDWFDVVRPTKLPTYEGEFGSDGNAYFSVRQTRFGTKGYLKTPLGELKTIFEFELFGTGVDAARQPSGCVMPMPSWDILVSASTGARSWILTFSQIQLNTGDQPVWYSSGIYRYVICQSWVIHVLLSLLNVPGQVRMGEFMPTVSSSQV
jgi:hypothetical protein